MSRTTGTGTAVATVALATSPTPRPRRVKATSSTRQTAGERREDILVAAAIEFAARGLDGTSTEAIARRAGVSQPYLFRLFGTKKALFLATLERGFDRIHGNFQAAAEAAASAGADPFEAMGVRYMEMLLDRDELLLQLHTYAACGDDEVRSVARRRYGELWQWLESLPEGLAKVRPFMAAGMLLNVAAALDLLSIVTSEEWAASCVARPPQP